METEKVITGIVIISLAALLAWGVKIFIDWLMHSGFIPRRIRERRFERLYLRALKTRERYVPVSSVSGKLDGELELESIFVPLKLSLRPNDVMSAQGSLACMPPDCERRTAEDVLEKHNKVVLLGQPGCGKSTLVTFMALQHAEGWRLWGRIRNIIIRLLHARGLAYQPTFPLPDKKRFPILVRLRNLDEDRDITLTAENLGRLTCGEDLAAEVPANFFRNRLKTGRCIVFLDGMDEIPGSKRPKAADQIHSLVTTPEFERNLFILTSRIHSYERVNGFKVHTICGFEMEDILTYAKKWYSPKKSGLILKPSGASAEFRDAGKKAQMFVNDIQANKSARDLAINPLLLSMLASAYQPGSALPARRIEFYDLCLHKMLGQRSGDGSGHSCFSADIKERVLRTVAFWEHCKQPPTGDKRKLETQVGQILPDVGQEADFDTINTFVTEVTCGSNVLVSISPTEYRFTHRTFRECLAAKHLADKEKSGRAEVLKRLHDPDWSEVILFYVGSIGEERAEDFIETLLDGRKDPLCRNLLFAARCLGELVKVRTPVQQRVIGGLVEEFCHARYEGLRQEARSALLSLGSGHWAKPVRDALIELLNSSDTTVIYRAALALVKLEEMAQPEQIQPEILVALVNMLCHEGLQERLEAHYALGALDSVANLTNGLLLLVKRPITQLRGGAALALGVLGKTEKAPLHALVNLLNDDKAVVRRRAAAALGWIGQSDPEIVKGLQNNLKCPNEQVRGISASALGEIGAADENVIESLTDALSDKDPAVAGRVISALGRLGRTNKDVLEKLLSHCTDDDHRTRARAANALEELGLRDEQVAEKLLELMRNDPDIGVKGSAAATLGWLGFSDRPVIVALLQNIGAKDKRLVECVSYALTWLERSDHRVRPIIIKAMDNTDPLMRASACAAIGRLGITDETALDNLIIKISGEGNSDPEPRVRIAATSALRRIGLSRRRIVEALVIELRVDDNSDVRWRAALALGSFDLTDPVVTRALTERLENDEDQNVMLRCADALARMAQKGGEVEGLKHKSVEDALIKLLDNADPRISRHAALALGWLRDVTDAALVALVQTLERTEDQVRSACAFSLGKLGRVDMKVVVGLVDHVSDTNAEVRARAAAALAELASDPTLANMVAELLQEGDTERRTGAAMTLFVLIRALDQELRLWLPRNKLGVLRNLLTVTTPVGHPFVGNKSTVQDVAWWLLKEYNRDYPGEYDRSFPCI